MVIVMPFDVVDNGSGWRRRVQVREFRLVLVGSLSDGCVCGGRVAPSLWRGGGWAASNTHHNRDPNTKIFIYYRLL